MRYVIIHYCAQDQCNCADKNGIIAYDGFDSAEAEYWLTNVALGYSASDESNRYR